MPDFTKTNAADSLTPGLFRTAERLVAIATITIGPCHFIRTNRQGGIPVHRSLVILATLALGGTDSHPADAPKRHVEKIAAGRHVYVVRQGGTMDGVNCRSPIGVG